MWWDLGDVEPAAVYLDKEEYRRRIPMPALVNFLGLQWDAAHKFVRCPFHKNGQERTPSMLVDEHSVYCFPCKRSWDIFQLVMDQQHCTFSEAIYWLSKHESSLAGASPVTIRPKNASYRGSVNQELVESWIEQLTPARRCWLHNRLLTDQTINRLGIGWSPTRKAYSIPFWRGVPFKSEIDIVQFRSTPLSDGEWRYRGLSGHNRPSIINRHSIRPGAWAILLYGTFDSALADQDGLIAQSANGATAFDSKESLDRLHDIYTLAGSVFVVPDNNEAEIVAAHDLVTQLNDPKFCVRYFPIDSPKDYTDWRLAGKSKLDFLWEVVMMQSPLINLVDQSYIETLMERLCQGNWDGVETYLAIFQPNYRPWIISHALQLLAQFQPFDTFSPEEWVEFRIGLETNWNTYQALAKYLHDWTEKASDNLGGF